MSDTVHIALAADALYETGMKLVEASMRVFAGSNGHRLKFHEFRAWPQDVKLPRPLTLAYIRLFLPNLLPDEDFVIWSDVDTLWRRDVSELWAMRNPEVLIMAPHDRSPETIRNEGAWMKANGYAIDLDKYFCSGVMLLNLKKMREEGFVDRCYEFIAGHHDLLLADQSVLNALYSDRVSFLDESWNVFSRNATKEDFQTRDVVIHFAGETPWLFRYNLDMLTDTRLEWFRAYASLVRKCPLSQALGECLSNAALFWRRLLFNVSANVVLRPLLYLLLCVAGRRKVALTMRIWARRI